MFRRVTLLVGVLCLSVVAAAASMRIGIWPQEKNRTRYLVYEPINLIISLENISPNGMELANGRKAWLDFLVSDQDGRPISAENVLVQDPLYMPSGDVKNISVNLTPLFTMRDPGRYRVRAVINVEGQPQMISKSIWLYLDRGRILWSDKRALNDDLLHYSLLAFSPTPSTSRLYLRVEDPASNLVHTTQSLGTFTQVVPSKQYFDDNGNLHIMHTIGQGTYGYSRTDARGNLRSRIIYDSNPDNPPRLRQQADGSVLVYGGMKRGKDNRPKLSESQQLADGDIPTDEISGLRPSRAQPHTGSSLYNPEKSDESEVVLDEEGSVIPPNSEEEAATRQRKANANRHNSKGR